MRTTILTCLALALLTPVARAQILISTNVGNSYSQNFDSLANAGSAVNWADNTTLPGWYASRQVSGTFTNYTVGTGSANSGALYSFGVAGLSALTERALGSVASGTPQTIAYGMRFQNDTLDQLSAIVLTYTGEQWRNGGNTTPQKLTFSYRISNAPITDADATNAVSWTSLPALDFTSPVATATAAALDGNASANWMVISVPLTDLIVAPGEEIFFRWSDANDAGNDHGLAVDDLTVTYTRETGVLTGPSITTEPLETSAAVWTTPSLSVLAGGTPPLNYYWFKNGNLISDGGNVSGTKSNLITFGAVLHANAGQYQVVVSNSVSMATSAPVNLTVVGFAITPVTVTNTLTATPVTVGFSFVDSQTAITSVTATSGNQPLLLDTDISISSSGNDRTATLSPAAGMHGVAVVTVSASDGGYTTNLTFPLVVVPSAEVVFNDYFDYADGSLTAGSGFLWQNHGGTGGDLQVISAQSYLSRSATEDVNARLIGQPYRTNSSSSLYAKFTVNFSSTDSPTAAGSYFAHFKDANFNFRARIWASTNASGNLRLGIGNASSATASSGMFPLDLAYNTPYLVVARIDLHDGTSTLWVNPTNQNDVSVTANDGQSTTNGINVVSFALRQNSGISKLFFDDLVVATSFDAATGLTTTPPSADTLTLTPSGANAVLNWANSLFLLQSAPAINGPFTAVLGASSPYTTGATNSQQYFRLKY